MSTGHAKPLRLVADIGGTHARFALAHPGSHELLHEHELATSDYPDIESAIERYYSMAGAGRAVEAALAIANPVTGDAVKMTNNTWAFSIAKLQSRLGLERLLVLNDFEALALSVPALPARSFRKIGPGEPVRNAPMALIGPGTGLGMAGLIHIDGDWHPLVSEGGHATAPVSRPREMAVVAQLAQQFDHVSAERLVSGPGLVHLYGALAAIDGQTVPPLTAEEISAKGQTEDDAYCHEALEMFCGLLGTLAGDLALVLAARGGVYLGGGIVPRLGEFFVRSSFRERFEAKGRMRALLSGIPTFVIEAPRAAMLGDLVALDRSGTASH